MPVVLVVGTGTGVGKTWVAARLLAEWRGRGLAVAARKPAESGGPQDGPADSVLLAAATGEERDVVCPPERRFEVPLAPPMAAAALGRPTFTVADLADLRPGPGTGVCVVETAGGVRSPQAADGDALDLARLVGPAAVLVVADAGLGTLNAVRLTVDALAAVAGPAGRSLPVVVTLNRYDEAVEVHRRNLSWLVEVDGLPVVPVAVDGGVVPLAAAVLAALVPD